MMSGTGIRHLRPCSRPVLVLLSTILAVFIPASWLFGQVVSGGPAKRVLIHERDVETGMIWRRIIASEQRTGHLSPVNMFEAHSLRLRIRKPTRRVSGRTLQFSQHRHIGTPYD